MKLGKQTRVYIVYSVRENECGLIYEIEKLKSHFIYILENGIFQSKYKLHWNKIRGEKYLIYKDKTRFIVSIRSRKLN